MFIKRLKGISQHVNSAIYFKLIIVDSFFSRLIGLMFKKHIASDQAMLIKHCKWVHTCFVKFELDLIFLNKEFRVIQIKHIKPFRISLPVKDGLHVLELKAGCAKSYNIEIGDYFIIEGTKDREI